MRDDSARLEVKAENSWVAPVKFQLRSTSSSVTSEGKTSAGLPRRSPNAATLQELMSPDMSRYRRHLKLAGIFLTDIVNGSTMLYTLDHDNPGRRIFVT